VVVRRERYGKEGASVSVYVCVCGVSQLFDFASVRCCVCVCVGVCWCVLFCVRVLVGDSVCTCVHECVCAEKEGACERARGMKKERQKENVCVCVCV